MPSILRPHLKKVIALGLLVSLGFFWLFLVDTSHASQVTLRSDTLSNAGISTTSNHTIAFTVQNSINSDGSLNGTTASNTLSVTFPSDFNLSTITCNDLDLSINGAATSINVSSGGANTTCLNGATSWGALIDSANRVITFTSPTSAAPYAWVATGTPLAITVGYNATFQGQGTHAITNTSSAGTQVITIGGTFGGTGNMDVAIIQSVQLSATVAETLTLTLAGLTGNTLIGSGSLAGCLYNGQANDNDDGATPIIAVNTTAATVPFGTLTFSNWFYEGCIKVSVTTNAGYGYTVRTRENNPMQTLTGINIPDTACDSNGCLNTPSTSHAWLNASNNGLGISCFNASTSVSCSLANPQFANAAPSASSGKNWAPIANEGSLNPTGGNQTPAAFSGLSVATSVEVITKAKFRLSVSVGQPAGTYTNLVSFIATPVY